MDPNEFTLAKITGQRRLLSRSRHLRIERSCCCELFWHCRRLPRRGLREREKGKRPSLTKERRSTDSLRRFDLPGSWFSSDGQVEHFSLARGELLCLLPFSLRPRRPKRSTEWPFWCFPFCQPPILRWSTSIDCRDLNQKLLRVSTCPRDRVKWRLVLTSKHIRIGVVRDGVEMGRHLRAFLPTIGENHFHRVDGQAFVRVDHHAEETRIRLGIVRRENEDRSVTFERRRRPT